MKHYLTSIAAYLTGWVIAQAIFIRLYRHIQYQGDEAGKNAFADRVADRITANLATRDEWQGFGCSR
jgi:hypothetical protein